MTQLGELFAQGKVEEIWDRCCGFIDLSIEDFMKIQERLLQEQLELLKKCELGKHIFNGATPTNSEELRRSVPLTTYADYAPFLTKRRMDILPKRPILWQYTSGKNGEYAHRWAPVTARQMDEVESLVWAMALFSSCNKRKDINIRPNDAVLYGMAPPPYATGTIARCFPHEKFNFLPKVEEAERIPFEDRVKKGFQMALSEGLDYCLSMSSVTVALGNRFSQSSGKISMKFLLSNPKAMLRLLKGKIKAKLAGRPMLPKDLWKVKGLMTYGIDGSVYREKIKEQWGRYPLDFHGCTEAFLIATQTWDYSSMTFVPYMQFFEFIPEEEAVKSWRDTSYQPKTLLMDELKPGNYEVVITSFHGGPFVRYRLGHLVQITSLRNEALDIDIPQMIYLTRVDDQIDIAGFTRLSEKGIWQAIENSRVEYVDWVACKERVNNTPRLHLYIEPKDNTTQTKEEVTASIHEELKKVHPGYADLESFIGLMPLDVTFLPKGAFKLYKIRQQNAGADLSDLKPPHLNPSAGDLAFMLNTPTKATVKQEEAVKV
ncbi:GH3 auxin-responsive promoter [Dehalococcoides mccartyi CG4]|uniref:GH3 family domain-containing protein n=1 Tax=Dehalococcoides mccartyi TaxID=61435 RepID=UPI0004E061BC|nr:GH3 auxin-responsive promoter family protein [Dehalococcoides mccartyi]AII59922.1 GH3 auxin-responsive promoter [Dehalococcoides mccartyi CG4]